MAKYLSGKYNHLCPEDYVRMIKKFVNSNKKYTKDDIFNYCIANSQNLDDGDETEIKRLIDNSLKTFIKYEKIYKKIKKKNDVYYTVSPVNDIIIFDDDDIPKMNISAETIENLNKIQGESMNFDFWDENEIEKTKETRAFGMTEEEFEQMYEQTNHFADSKELDPAIAQFVTEEQSPQLVKKPKKDKRDEKVKTKKNRAFGMTEEEFEQMYEQTNHFADSKELDPAIAQFVTEEQSPQLVKKDKKVKE